MPAPASFPIAEFHDADAAAAEAARLIAGALSARLAEDGRALFLASGGSTPFPAYARLFAAPLDWERVTILTVDERIVPLDHPQSNEGALRRALAGAPASAASLRGLLRRGAEEGALASEESLALLAWPAAAAMMGMGADGHTASWFPKAEGLGNALAPPDGRRAVRLLAHDAKAASGLPRRASLTAPAVCGAGRIVLLLKGEEKRAAFQRFAAPGPVEEAPVRRLLREGTDRLFVLWSP